jgi:hypothetical protein
LTIANILKTKMDQIKVNKVYSAREAVKFMPDLFQSDVKFREYLVTDMAGINIFNAKKYVTASLPRFVIRGTDLKNGIQCLRTHCSN